MWICLLPAALAGGVGLWRSGHAPATSRGPERRAAPARGSVLTAPLPQPKGTLSIHGKVLGADGRPVAQAAVIATAGGQDLSTLPSGCPGLEEESILSDTCPGAVLALADLAEQRQHEAPAISRALSNPDGSFELPGLEEGAVSLWAESAGRGIALLPEVKAGAQDVELRLDAGRVLEGAVVGDQGEPLAGATVTALSGEHRRYFDGQSGPDGRFLIGPVPRGEYTLVANLDGRLPARASTEDEPPLKLELFTPRRLSGVVLRDGHGVSGARVQAAGVETDDGPEVTSDARGQFTLGSLAPGVYRVIATSGGERGTEWVKLEPGVDGSGVEVTLGEGSEVSGVVVDAGGQPIAGARILAFAESRGAVRVETGPDGHYRAGPLAAGSYNLRVEAKGYVSSEQNQVRLAPGERQELKFTLRAGATLRGLVVDPEGRPVQGAAVAASGGDDHSLDGRETKTGADGRFELEDLAPGEYEVQVDHVRFKPASTTLTVPGPDAQVVLERGGAIDVRVVDERDRPVEGVELELVLHASDEMMEVAVDRNATTPSTNAEGHVLIEGLEAGRYHVSAKSAVGVARHGAALVEVREDATSSARIRLRQGKSIRGVVVDANDRPLAGATVNAMVVGDDASEAAVADGARDFAEAETGPDGRFELQDLREGLFEVSATKDGFSSDHEPPPVEAGAGAMVKVALRPAQPLRLRVLRDDGRPLTSFEVDGFRQLAPDGEAELAMPEAPESHVLSASGYAPARVTFDPAVARDRPIEVVLHPGRRVTGRVINARTGAPVAGAELRVSFPDELERPNDTLDARSGPAGEFTLSHVDDGCVVRAEKERFRPAERQVAPGEGTVTLELAPLARLSGVILPPGGDYAGLMVSAMGPTRLAVHPGPDGTFELPDLLEGEYTVTLLRADAELFNLAGMPRLLDSQRVTLTAGADTRLELRARQSDLVVRVVLQNPPPGTLLRSVLLAGHFAPPPPPHLYLALERAFEEGTNPVETTGNTFTFRLAIPGHYTLLISRDVADPEFFSQELDVPDGGELTLPVQLPAGWRSEAATGQ